MTENIMNLPENNIHIILICPHCNESILIERLNCCIFRHGVLKTNGKQINPHASKELCDFYIEKQLIYGCGKPFRIILNEINGYVEYNAIKCDYI